MTTATLIASVDAVAALETPTTLQDRPGDAMRQLDARAVLYQQLSAAMVPQIGQAVRRMTTEWPNEAIVWRLSGTEVSDETYDIVNRFGGLLLPDGTIYGCIFFTFTLRRQTHKSRASRKGAASYSLYIENVKLTSVLGKV